MFKVNYDRWYIKGRSVVYQMVCQGYMKCYYIKGIYIYIKGVLAGIYSFTGDIQGV